MIKIYIHEQLGNQLFQYATAKKLATDKKQKIYIDHSFFGFRQKRYFLNHFNLQFKTSFTLWHLLLKKVGIRKKRAVDYSKNIKFGYSHQYNPEINNFTNVYLYGLFQSYLFFYDIRDILRKEITPKYKLKSIRYKYFYKQICESNSVAIHIRRGDYIGNKKLEVCNMKYFINAIKYIKEKINVPTFFIFSNDIKFCKGNFKGKEYIIVDGNSNQIILEDFILMKSCKHHIISNSTFSWWPAFLAENNIVTVPYKWDNDNQIPITEKYLPEWKIIHF